MSPEQAAKDRTEAFIRTRLPSEVTEAITGNTSVEIKELPVKWLVVFRNNGRGFAGDVASRLKVVDVSIVTNPDDALKEEGKVACEIEVTPDMCNGDGKLNEGCIVFLIDECSTLAMVVINAHLGLGSYPGVSMTINAYYHSSAAVGTRLRIVSTSLASGEQSNAGKCEVWDNANHRLVASGAQQTMPPSKPATWMKEKHEPSVPRSKL